jgi:hypothetical protein
MLLTLQGWCPQMMAFTSSAWFWKVGEGSRVLSEYASCLWRKTDPQLLLYSNNKAAAACLFRRYYQHQGSHKSPGMP